MDRIIDLRKGAKEKLQASQEAETLKSKEPENNDMSWQAPSFYRNNSKRYLWMVVTVLFIGAGTMLFTSDDPLTAIFLILSSVVLIIYSNKEPEILDISIDGSGIQVGNNSFLYKELKSFWIDYRPGENKELSVEPKKWYLPYVKVPLENKSPLHVRAHLINFLPEKEHEETLADLIVKKIGL